MRQLKGKSKSNWFEINLTQIHYKLQQIITGTTEYDEEDFNNYIPFPEQWTQKEG